MQIIRAVKSGQFSRKTTADQEKAEDNELADWCYVQMQAEDHRLARTLAANWRMFATALVTKTEVSLAIRCASGTSAH